MVSFNRKRLQVFVSSTYSDLIEERQAAVSAILTAGHIPAGMELFTSGDESQMDVIKQWIDESDVFLLILGGRYGSIEPNSGKSYIHLEYEYAVDKGKPLFACVIEDSAIDTRVRESGTAVIETDHTEKLKEFRELVLSKMVRFWEDSKDIKISIGETLSSFARNEDLIGWVRANTEAHMPALTDELVRLSKENARLREQIKSIDLDEKILGVSFQDLYRQLVDRELLTPLMQNRFSYGGSDGHCTSKMVDDLLSTMGLIEARTNEFGESFYLTDAGRIFINKLEALRANS